METSIFLGQWSSLETPYQLEAEEMEAKAEFVETELNPLAGAPELLEVVDFGTEMTSFQ